MRTHGRFRRGALFLSTFAVMSAAVAWQLSADRPANAPSAEVHTIPLEPGFEIAQTFVAPWNGLRRIRIRPAVDGEPSGTLRLAIDHTAARPTDVLDPDLRTVDINIRGVRTDRDVDVAFPPIPDSAGQHYRLRLVAMNVHSGAVSVAANRDDTYQYGELSMNGRPVGGDLVFEAFSASPSATGLLAVVMRGRPSPFSSPLLFWTLLGLFCAAVSWIVLLAADVSASLPRQDAGE